MTLGATDLPPEGMLLGGVALAGDPAKGTATTEGLSLLFSAAGITVQGPQPGNERLLAWTGLDSASCNERTQLGNGEDAVALVLTASGQSVRFLLPSSNVSPGQAAYLDQALPQWLDRYRAAGQAAQATAPPPPPAATAPPPPAPAAAPPPPAPAPAPPAPAPTAPVAPVAPAAQAASSPSAGMPATAGMAATAIGAAAVVTSPGVQTTSPAAPPAPQGPAPAASTTPLAAPEGAIPAAATEGVAPDGGLLDAAAIDPATGAAVWPDPMAAGGDVILAPTQKEKKSRFGRKKKSAEEAATAAVAAAATAAVVSGTGTAPPPPVGAPQAQWAAPPAPGAPPPPAGAPGFPPPPPGAPGAAGAPGFAPPPPPPGAPGTVDLPPAPDAYQASEPGSANGLVPVGPVAPAPVTPEKNRRPLYLLIGLLVVIALAGGFYYWHNHKSSSTTTTTTISTPSTGSSIGADAALAASVNITRADLPAGWTVSGTPGQVLQVPTAERAATAAAVPAFASCLGVSETIVSGQFGHTVGAAVSARSASPRFALAGSPATTIDSRSAVLRSSAAVTADQAPFKSPKFVSCFQTFQESVYGAAAAGTTVQVSQVQLAAAAPVVSYGYISTVTIPNQGTVVNGQAFVFGGRVEAVLEPVTNVPPFPSDAFNMSYQALLQNMAAASTK